MENVMTQTSNPVRLTKVGDHYALLIDESVMASAGIAEGTPVRIVAKAGELTITAAPELNRDEKFRLAQEKIDREWSDVFRRLAE
jgi:hypothetical protein